MNAAALKHGTIDLAKWQAEVERVILTAYPDAASRASELHDALRSPSTATRTSTERGTRPLGASLRPAARLARAAAQDAQ